MRLQRYLFIALAGSHALLAVFTPPGIAPAVAASVYLPLIPWQAAGIPVFTGAESGGWSYPSVLGWVIVLAAWLAIWWAVAYGVSRLITQRAIAR